MHTYVRVIVKKKLLVGGKTTVQHFRSVKTNNAYILKCIQQKAILWGKRRGHFVILSFCHSVILSFWHFVILSFCHSGILSFWHSVILSFWHFVILSFCPLALNLFQMPQFLMAWPRYEKNII
jgi:hypothetical protein